MKTRADLNSGAAPGLYVIRGDSKDPGALVCLGPYDHSPEGQARAAFDAGRLANREGGGTFSLVAVFSVGAS